MPKLWLWMENLFKSVAISPPHKLHHQHKSLSPQHSSTPHCFQSHHQAISKFTSCLRFLKCWMLRTACHSPPHLPSMPQQLIHPLSSSTSPPPSHLLFVSSMIHLNPPSFQPQKLHSIRQQQRSAPFLHSPTTSPPSTSLSLQEACHNPQAVLFL